MRIIILLLLSSTAFADDPHHDYDDGSVTTGNVTNSIGRDESLALGLNNALGDVDIAQCIVSKQKGNVLWSWQNYDYNVDCLAIGLERNGKYAEAAALRCQAIPVLALIIWPNNQTCEEAIVAYIEKPIVPTSGPLIKEVVVVAQEQGIKELNDLENRLARIESGQRIAAQKAQERRDYAQQTMEKFENDPEE